jgi:hypothetical protein
LSGESYLSNSNAKGSKKGKKAKFQLVFALFALFASTSLSTANPILKMCPDTISNQ